MKFIENLTRDELVKLTMEEKEIYLQRELAKRGVENLEEPVLETETIPAPDVTYYKIDEFTHYFKDRKDAEKVLDAIRAAKGEIRSISNDWDLNLKHEGSDDYYIKSGDNYSIIPYGVYSENLYTSIRLIAKKNVDKKKVYNDLLKAYQENQKKVREAWDYVDNIIDEAVADYSREKKHVSEYKRMLKLSEGNEAIARNFFSNTYFSLNEDEVNRIISIATQPEDQTALESLERRSLQAEAPGEDTIERYEDIRGV